jgi:hypothetical protein
MKLVVPHVKMDLFLMKIVDVCLKIALKKKRNNI